MALGTGLGQNPMQTQAMGTPSQVQKSGLLSGNGWGFLQGTVLEFLLLLFIVPFVNQRTIKFVCVDEDDKFKAGYQK